MMGMSEPVPLVYLQKSASQLQPPVCSSYKPTLVGSCQSTSPPAGGRSFGRTAFQPFRLQRNSVSYGFRCSFAETLTDRPCRGSPGRRQPEGEHRHLQRPHQWFQLGLCLRSSAVHMSVMLFARSFSTLKRWRHSRCRSLRPCCLFSKRDP